MKSPSDSLDRLRAQAVEMGLKPESVDGFADMNHDTLVLQAALWHSLAISHQNEHLNSAIRSGEAITALFDLCRQHGVTISDELYDQACGVEEVAKPNI